MKKPLRVFEAFAGIGTQRMALDRLGIDYELVAVSEVDEYVLNSYDAIHNTTSDTSLSDDDKANYLEDLHIPLDNKGKRKILKGKRLNRLAASSFRNSNLGDISKIEAEQVPDHDLFTYSFPCTDISISGEQKGFNRGSGTRSGLLWEAERIIEAKRPRYLLMENVKNLVGKTFLPGFQVWIDYLESLGYANHWEVLNASDYGVPQNRERVFMVSILDGDGSYVFPNKEPLETFLEDLLEDEVGERYILTNEGSELLRQELLENYDYDKVKETPRILQVGNTTVKTKRVNPQTGRTYDPRGISPTLNTMQGGYRQPQVILPIREDDRIVDYTIRQLTPLECWRLMGIDDEDYQKVVSFTSNAQLYKMAGNAIVVDVLEGIFRQLFFGGANSLQKNTIEVN